MSKETISAKGTVFLQIFNAKGELIEETTKDNLIVNVGKESLARLLGAATTGKKVTKIGFGTVGTDPVGGNTANLGEVVNKALNGVSYSGTSAVFDYSLELSEGNGNTIREFALYSNDNTLFARITRSGINKTADIRLAGTWTITF